MDQLPGAAGTGSLPVDPRGAMMATAVWTQAVDDRAPSGMGGGPSITEVMREHRGEEVALYPNPGNAGDGLINGGARRYLRANGMVPVAAAPGAGEGRPSVAFLVGAGGFSRPFHHNADIFPPLFRLYRRLYVLPASFDPDCPESNRFLRELPAHVTVFCREAYSYRHARSLSPYPGNVGIGHDMAFHFRYDRWRSVAGAGTLLAFRDDPERSLRRGSLANLDVSRLGTERDYPGFLSIISRFEQVHTDRLHIAIAATVMGKQVHLYPSSYWKNRGVYELSMATREGVRFAEAAAPSARGRRWWALRYAWEVARRPPSRRRARLVLSVLWRAARRYRADPPA